MATRGQATIWCAAAWLLLLPAAAAGQEAVPPDGVKIEESKKHFQDGVTLFKKGLWTEALDEFMASYDRRPHWGVFYNIGICYEKMGQKGRALAALLKFIEQGGADVPEAKATQVSTVINALMAEVGVVRFQGSLVDAAVFVDGEYYPDAPRDMYVYVDPGERYIRVVAAGAIVYENIATVEKGQELLVVLPAPPPPVVEEEDAPAPAAAKAKKGGLPAAGDLGPLVWSFVALTGGLLVGYAAAGGVAVTERDAMREAEDAWEADPQAGRYDEAVADRDAHHDRAAGAMIAADVLFAAALASAAVMTGLLAWKLTRGQKKEKAPVAVGGGISPGGMVLSIAY